VEIGESRSFETFRVTPARLNTDPVSTRPIGPSRDGEYDGIDLARLDTLTAE